MFALEISNKWAEAERKSIFSEIGLRREPSVQGFVWINTYKDLGIKF